MTPVLQKYRFSARFWSGRIRDGQQQNTLADENIADGGLYDAHPVSLLPSGQRRGQQFAHQGQLGT